MPESSFPNTKYMQLCEFAHAVWGNSNAVLQHSGDINFIDLQPYYAAFQYLFAGAVTHDKILIREEYCTALQALETKTYYEGAYVTGQPGIGKTLFLIYALVIQLGKKHAVALQLPNGQPYYALFHSSVSFHSLNDPKPLDKFPNLWALSDSNKYVKSPSGIFLGSPEDIRVIQTTAPEETHWKEWSKQTRAIAYVMDIWSVKEILDLSEILRLDAKQMALLAKKWGGTPQRLLQFISEQEDDSKIEARYRQYALQAIFECGKTICAIRLNAHIDDALSCIFFCQPQIATYGINHKYSRATVPTQTIQHLLGEALQFQTNDIKLNFLKVLCQYSDTSQVASIIFKNWFHSFLAAGKAIQCNQVQGTDNILVEGQTTPVPSNTNWTQALVESWDPPYLWIAPRNSEGIDSVLVLKEQIYAFQVAIHLPRNESPTQGMERFQENLPSALRKLPWSVIFIGNNISFISNIAHKWRGKIFFPTNEKEVSIAWSVVDPIDPGIIYQEFH